MSLEDKFHGLLGAYISSPQWVKSLVGGTYSLLPKTLRRGYFYARYRFVLGLNSPVLLARYSREQLGRTLEWAVRTVPAYRNVTTAIACINNPLGALPLFPCTSKVDIKRNPDAFLSTSMSASARLRSFTGGSTAEPMVFFLEKGVSRSREYAFMEDFHARAGVGDQDVVLALRGRTVSSAGKPGGRIWMYEPIKRQLILSSDHLEPRFMPQYIAALRAWKPTCIQAFPSAIYPLARWLATHPAPDVTTRIKAIMLYSENVYGFQTDLLRKVFGCPVLKHYGHSERVLMAASMPDDERYFFWPQYGHFELVDEAGQVITKPGVLGEIIGTSFDNRVMPFIRYRTGDLAMLSDGPAAGALTGYPVVERIEGRLQEFLVTRDHRLISVCTMGAAHFDALAQMEAIQYEQHEPGMLCLKVVAGRRLTQSERKSIEYAVQEKTQGGCDVRVREVDAIPRTRTGKHVMLIQDLDISEYLGASPKELLP